MSDEVHWLPRAGVHWPAGLAQPYGITAQLGAGLSDGFLGRVERHLKPREIAGVVRTFGAFDRLWQQHGRTVAVGSDSHAVARIRDSGL
ncbi:hypothetical protein ADL00_40295 [Streptomyces sp. AS58]|nr:hypothetical protein ADL00_40295 [Streptomyces sp. AS58]